MAEDSPKHDEEKENRERKGKPACRWRIELYGLCNEEWSYGQMSSTRSRKMELVDTGYCSRATCSLYISSYKTHCEVMLDSYSPMPRTLVAEKSMWLRRPFVVCDGDRS